MKTFYHNCLNTLGSILESNLIDEIIVSENKNHFSIEWYLTNDIIHTKIVINEENLIIFKEIFDQISLTINNSTTQQIKLILNDLGIKEIKYENV